MQGNMFAHLLASSVQQDNITRSSVQFKSTAKTGCKPQNAFAQLLERAKERPCSPVVARKTPEPDNRSLPFPGKSAVKETGQEKENRDAAKSIKTVNQQTDSQPSARTAGESDEKDRAMPADSQVEAPNCADSLPGQAEQSQPAGVIPANVVTGSLNGSVILQGDAEGSASVSIQNGASADASLGGAVTAAGEWQGASMTEMLESDQEPAQDEGELFTLVQIEKEGPRPAKAKPASSLPQNDVNQVRVEVAVTVSGSSGGQDDQTGQPAAGGDKTAANRGLHLGHAVAEARHLRNEQRKEIQEQNKDLPEQKNQPAQGRTDVKKIIDMESARMRGAESGKEQKPEKQEGAGKDTGEAVAKALDTPELQRSLAAKETRTARPQFENLMNQIVEKARIMVKDHKSTVTIQLKPEFLGKLHIQLTVEGGVLTARFIAANNQVKELLEGGLNQLKMVLENTGIRLERAEVSTDFGQTAAFSGYDSWNWQQGRQSGFDGSAGYHSGAELTIETEDYDTPLADAAESGDGGTGLNLVV